MEQRQLIEAQDLSFGYAREDGETRQVIEQLNLSIAEGMFVSILGHNGSGKSTLAKLINALLAPSSGVLRVCQIDTRDSALVWEIRQNVGMVFQNPDNQIIGTTVEDDVAFGLENIGVDPAEMRTRVDDALKAVQMERFLKNQPHKLSGGQKQRVAIAGIIALRPSVIILDEATSMLDPQGRKEVMALVHRLNRDEGITVLNITHFPEETLYSDRVIVMRGGRIYKDGTPEQVYTDVEALQAVGIDVPFAVRLRHRLVRQGADLEPTLHQEGLVDALCKLLLKV